MGTNSGTAMSFGTEVPANSTYVDDGNVVYDPHAGHCVIVFGDVALSNQLAFRPATISGTGVTFGTATNVNIGVNGSYYYSLSPYTSQNKLVATFYGLSGHADGVVYQSVGTNIAGFIGITGQAISDTATGNVDMLGGINSQQTSLVIGSKYYVQDNGTLGTTVTSTFAGQAVSATTLNIRDLT